eukprot:g5536.t1
MLECTASKKDKRTPSVPRISQKVVQLSSLLGKDIFTVDGVFTALECQQSINLAESLGFVHQGSRGAAFQEAVRDNDRVSITNPILADHLWNATGLSKIFSEIQLEGMQAIGLNPNIRFYKYSKGQKFGRHVDDSVSFENSETKYTLLIYLSGSGPSHSIKQDSLSGGETIFYGKKNRVLASVVPKTGMALLHIHGDKCHEHEGVQVKDLVS